MFDVRVRLAGLWLVAGVMLASGPRAAAAGGDGALRRDVRTLSAESFEGRGAGTAGLERALDYLEKRFRETGLRPFGVDGYRQAFAGPGGTTLVNLIGVLGESSGGTHVVVGAHYDHLGRGGPGDANRGALHPGADDNASGVAVLLECARRLAEEGGLAHPVVFIAFSGEEKGLLGSAYYVEHPVLPLGGCIGMVNLDTVGRLFDGPLTVFGTATAREWPHVLRGINYGFGFELALPENDPGASDQASFVGRGVAAVQIFTGPHADYHRPGDTADKIDYEGLERVAALTAELATYLAGRDAPMGFVPPGADKAAAAAPSRGGRGRRVSFGSIPDFNYSGDGVRISGVIPGSPAERAGLEKGDVLLEFAGAAVEDLRAFSNILKGLSPGDEVDVVFVRGGKRHTVTATVVERR